MNGRLLLCIAMGVFVIHLGIFMILDHIRRLREPPPVQPNFKVRSQTVVDRETGEKTIYRDITVSTKLGTPAATPAAKPVMVELEKQQLPATAAPRTFPLEEPQPTNEQPARR